MAIWAKPVTFSTRLGPNFLWHLLAVAKIGYDSVYAERYRHTVPVDALQALQANATLLRFGNGSSGAMSGLFAFLPAWLHLEDKVDFQSYFDSIVRSLREGSFSPLISTFPRVDWTDKAFAHLPALRFSPDAETESTFSSLADAYLAAYQPYADLVWPKAHASMIPRRDELADWFEREDYIAAWEQGIGLVFAAPSYEIVLCYANQGGPDCNSLGYSGNLFYFDKPFERTWQLVSHEIGTHLLVDAVAEAARALGTVAAELHRPFESLAMFYNRRVLRITDLAYDLPSCHGDTYMEFYSREYREGIGPGDLLQRAWQQQRERV